jgi:hypothetical protein
MISSNVNLLTDHQKKILLALIYNVLVSDQDYAEEEKYLFNNLIDLIDVSFNFNTEKNYKNLYNNIIINM